jgi:RNA polymerase sigma-70 factor (ECF subfamily)
VARHCRPGQGLDADDVAQEVRIRVWRAIEDGRIEDLRASYLQKLVVSVVVDGLRRARARQSEALETISETSFAGLETPAGSGPERSAARDERMVLLMRCIAELPERRRLPVQLHLQGFALDEVSRMAGTTVEGARKLVTRGMDEIRERLSALGVETSDE